MENRSMRFSQISLLTGLKRHTINARAKSIFKNNELKRTASNQILLRPDQVKSLIQDHLSVKKGKVIYLGNLKGGVGKTTLSYLLSSATSMLGMKTCVIDLDVQANLTQQYANIDVEQPVFYDVIEKKKDIKDVIVEITPTLHLIPSSLRNSLIQKALTLQSPKNHLSWFNEICLDYLRQNYDVIVVDTPPHLTTLNSVFCLCLTSDDQIAIPACAEDFSIMGVRMFLEDIVAIRDSYKVNSSPKISIIMNRFFQNQKTNLEMLLKIGQEYGQMLSEIIIRDSAKIREAVNNKIDITQVKQGKDLYETVSGLLKEFDLIKRTDA